MINLLPKDMENKTKLKLVLAPGIIFLTGLSVFIIFAREDAQGFFGLSSTSLTGDANFVFYPLTIYSFLIGCGAMYFKTEQLKYIEAILCMCLALVAVRIFSTLITGIEASNYTLLALPAEILLFPIIGYLWNIERKKTHVNS